MAEIAGAAEKTGQAGDVDVDPAVQRRSRQRSGAKCVDAGARSSAAEQIDEAGDGVLAACRRTRLARLANGVTATRMRSARWTPRQ